MRAWCHAVARERNTCMWVLCCTPDNAVICLGRDQSRPSMDTEADAHTRAVVRALADHPPLALVEPFDSWMVNRERTACAQDARPGCG